MAQAKLSLPIPNGLRDDGDPQFFPAFAGKFSQGDACLLRDPSPQKRVVRPQLCKPMATYFPGRCLSLLLVTLPVPLHRPLADPEALR